MASTIVQYLLAKLNEELAEAIQAASKSQRFGLDSQWKNKPSNVEQLRGEMEDVFVAWSMLADLGEVPALSVLTANAAVLDSKRHRLLRYYRLSARLGLVQPGLEVLLGVPPALEHAPPPCIMGKRCEDHECVHGSEAEELRKRIEGLIVQYPHGVAVEKLQWVLDTVDARDSVAYVRENPAEDPWYGD